MGRWKNSIAIGKNKRNIKTNNFLDMLSNKARYDEAKTVEEHWLDRNIKWVGDNNRIRAKQNYRIGFKVK